VYLHAVFEIIWEHELFEQRAFLRFHRVQQLLVGLDLCCGCAIGVTSNDEFSQLDQLMTKLPRSRNVHLNQHVDCIC